VTWVKCKLVPVYMEITLILVLDGCTVCAERTVGMEIVLVTLTVHLVDVGHGEARFGQLEMVLIST
jgi:uncharacterized metal-binding protein